MGYRGGTLSYIGQDQPAIPAAPWNTSLWLKYAEMEMRHRFVDHARNVWDRAATMLPRIDQLWYKYIHMEEMLGNPVALT